MNAVDDAGRERCSVCGGASDELSPIPGAGRVCSACLLAGRFLGSTGAPRLAQAARQLPELSPTARERINPVLSEAARLADRKLNDDARNLLLDHAREQLAADRPLLSAFLLQTALRIPGDSAGVYAGLGDAAAAMDCAREAVQHYKTSGWLAMKMGDRAAVERTVATLEQVGPADPWLEKARDWLAGKHSPTEPLCGFCGRPASEVGPLISGPQAAICQGCLDRLAARRNN